MGDSVIFDEMNSTMDYSWNSSYVFAVDNDSGWGERYFFTYFSQFDGRPTNYVAAEVTIFVLIFLVSVVANTSIVVCVVRYDKDPKVLNNTSIRKCKNK
jgi:hypothetical protein